MINNEIIFPKKETIPGKLRVCYDKYQRLNLRLFKFCYFSKYWF